MDNRPAAGSEVAMLGGVEASPSLPLTAVSITSRNSLAKEKSEGSEPA
jgi:hypothetical protein